MEQGGHKPTGRAVVAAWIVGDTKGKKGGLGFKLKSKILLQRAWRVAELLGKMR